MRILIVDANRAFIRQIKEVVFTCCNDIVIDTADNVFILQDKLKTNSYDLILADIMVSMTQEALIKALDEAPALKLLWSISDNVTGVSDRIRNSAVIPKVTIASSVGKPVILIVDDCIDNLRLLELALDERYKVEIARNGESALSMIEETPPDLILLDVIMPGMDGYETCRRIKNNKKTKDTPVLFVSGLDEVPNKLRAFNVGAIDYITKPFNLDETMARINAHLELRKIQKAIAEQNVRLRRLVQSFVQTRDIGLVTSDIGKQMGVTRIA